MKSAVICSLKSSVNHCWLCGSEVEKDRAGRPLVHSRDGNKSFSSPGSSCFIWGMLVGCGLLLMGWPWLPPGCLFVLDEVSEWSREVHVLQNTCGVNVPAPQRHWEEGEGKEGSALVHDYELCSVYLAGQTAEDLDLQCSFLSGRCYLGDTRKKRGLCS